MCARYSMNGLGHDVAMRLGGSLLQRGRAIDGVLCSIQLPINLLHGVYRLVELETPSCA